MSLRRTSVALLVLGALGAVAGYAREIGIATLFGAGMVTDVYFVALSVPIVIGDLLVGSVLTAVIVPVFAGVSAPQQTLERQRLFMASLITATGFAVLLALLAILFVPSIIGWLAPGFSTSAFDAACRATRYLIWLLPINAGLLVVTFALNSQRSFIVPGLTWLVANTLFVVTLLVLRGTLDNDVLLAAAMAGPAFMLCVNLAWAWRARLFRPVRPNFGSTAFREALLLGRPMLLTLGVGSGLGLLMFSHLLVRRFASHYGEGAVSAMSYAFRLYEVPISLITATVGTLLLPAFSDLHRRDEAEKLADATRRMIAWGFILLVPMAVFTAVEAELLVGLVFQWGHFHSGDVARTAQVLRGFSAAIVFEALFMVLFRALYSARRPETTAKIGFAALAALYFCLSISDLSGSLGIVALSLSLSFALAGIASLVSWGRILARPILPDRKVAGRALLAAAVVAVGLILVKGGSFPLLVHALLALFVGVAYFVSLKWLLPEYWRQAAGLARMGRTGGEG
jgi:putative peptidoglycan lipid II flippase